MKVRCARIWRSQPGLKLQERETRSIEVIQILRQVPDCCPDLRYVYSTDDTPTTLSRITRDDTVQNSSRCHPGRPDTPMHTSRRVSFTPLTSRSRPRAPTATESAQHPSGTRVHRESDTRIGTIPTPVAFVTVKRDTGGVVVAIRDTGQMRTHCLRTGKGCEGDLCIARARGMRLFASSHCARPY